jgi:hypothetical protein
MQALSAASSAVCAWGQSPRGQSHRALWPICLALQAAQILLLAKVQISR